MVLGGGSFVSFQTLLSSSSLGQAANGFCPVVTQGLAVHSRSVLVYPLDGQFESFKSLVGFDESAGGRGRVALRVLGDGKELFAKEDVRGDSQPLTLDLSVKGVGQLSLEVGW